MAGDMWLWFGYPSSQATATQHIVKSFLELLAEAWVDDRVDAAVEVTQPEGYLKDGFRGLTGWEDGS